MRLHCTHTHMHHRPVPQATPLRMAKFRHAGGSELVQAAREQVGDDRCCDKRESCGGEHAGRGGAGRGVRWDGEEGAAAAAVNLPLASAGRRSSNNNPSGDVVVVVGRSGSLSFCFASAPWPSAGRRRSRGAGHDARCLATAVGRSSLSSTKSSIRSQPLDGMRGRIYGSYAIMFEVPAVIHGTKLRCVYNAMPTRTGEISPTIWVELHCVMLRSAVHSGGIKPSTGGAHQ